MKTLAPQPSNRVRGFTMVELIVGSAVMLFAVIGALSVYSRSNKVAVEQQMVTEVQNDVRASMFFLSRDLRMAGAGLPEEFSSYFIQGVNNEEQGDVDPDRIQLMGNLDDPLNLPIRNYQGSSVVLDIEDFSFEQYSYPNAFYDNKCVLILPRPDSGCRLGEVRIVTHVTHNAGGTNERFNFSSGLAPGVNPPGGLSGTCPGGANDYDGGQISFIDVKEYWLDVTGNYTGLTAGVDGYIGGGQGGILYVTHNGVHFPMARNIENFQVEYNGDMDSDLNLDGWLPWQNTWTIDQIARIQQVRMWVLGRTDRAFTSVGGQVPGAVHIYRRPDVSDSPGAIDDPADPNDNPDDKHRRFLLESMSNVRNMSLNLYNLGQR